MDTDMCHRDGRPASSKGSSSVDIAPGLIFSERFWTYPKCKGAKHCSNKAGFLRLPSYRRLADIPVISHIVPKLRGVLLLDNIDTS
ncbi:uncharacterized protein STEHIDRAFT_116945 [Stereum hirsutum FP-91666 SS1]|uniref:uncharacterized protein n=1 Tax=Stereum hirsutum (strain FP-91666) TaxID=721885 RepID=UPI000440F636|nr:uncharacterized protein STEHIDRAFT_116945 [Stereum hirsutum FP-91666 SS1]EIM91812.1 hypothetical protein STEHIDRAFT_116945 [Stereum hirsutum FP-91666 SS1]